MSMMIVICLWLIVAYGDPFISFRYKFLSLFYYIYSILDYRIEYKLENFLISLFKWTLFYDENIGIYYWNYVFIIEWYS